MITNATASKKANEEDKQPDLASTPCRLRLLEEFIVLCASAMCKKGHKKIHPYFCIAVQRAKYHAVRTTCAHGTTHRDEAKSIAVA